MYLVKLDLVIVMQQNLYSTLLADVAQSIEHSIRNRKVRGLIPLIGFALFKEDVL